MGGMKQSVLLRQVGFSHFRKKWQISQLLNQLQNARYIAEITTEPERTGIDDITRFFGS
jgi:hypothetical protein